MPKLSKNLAKEMERIEKAYSKYKQYKKSDNIRMTRYWETRLKNLEEPLRILANNRLERVLKLGYGDKMGWYDKILSYIDTQHTIITPFNQDSVKLAGSYNRISVPHDAEEAYESSLVELQFLKSKTSTLGGIKKVLNKVRESAYSEFNMSEDEFMKFWKWRQQNPVHEFFKIFPPSPPELRGSVGTMVVDLWNSSEIEKNMLDDYFAEFKRFLDTQNDAIPQGIPTTLLIKRLDELYESIGKRRRGY